MREPQKPKIAHRDLFACDRQPAAIHDAAGSHMLGGIHDDVDPRAVLLRLLGDGGKLHRVVHGPGRSRPDTRPQPSVALVARHGIQP